MDSETNTSTEHFIKLEVCIDSIESALAAVRGGADRLEVCANLALGGGTTPSTGLVRLVRKAVTEHVDVMAMIRPRTGDFLYSTLELSVMQEDIRAFASVPGLTGVVFGALNADGTVDEEATRGLVHEAVGCGMQVCFHRAFDMVPDQIQALATLRRIPGITRILTSGGAPSAPQGLPSLLSLFSSYKTDPHQLSESTTETGIEIMPGSGINAQTITPLLRALLPHTKRGVSRRMSVHMSGGSFVDSSESGMLYRPKGMGMGVGEGEWRIWRTSEAAVRAVREILDKEWETYFNEEGKWGRT